MNTVKLNKSGFTILELLIATSVFSTILLICVYGLLSIGKSYSKGVNISRTQSIARSIIDTVGQSIEYGGSDPYPLNAANQLVSSSSTNFCIGDQYYEYQHNTQSQNNTSRYGLRVSKGCAAGAHTNSRLLLGKDMRIVRFNIQKNSDSSYTIQLKVGTGDDDLYDSNGDCINKGGGQFCATSSLETTVRQRVKPI